MRSQEGLIMLDERGGVVWANRDAAGLLGYEQSEIKDLALPHVGGSGGNGDVSGPVATAFNLLLAGESESAEGEARFPTKTGNRVAVRWRLWRMPAAAGGNVLLSLSETESASAEEYGLAGYRDIFEHAVEGIFRSTLDGRYLEVNSALARMYGFATPAELISVLRDIPHQLYVKPERREELIAVLLRDGYVNGFEAELKRGTSATPPSQGERWCECRTPATTEEPHATVAQSDADNALSRSFLACHRTTRSPIAVRGTHE